MRQFIKTRVRRALVALPVSAALVVVLLPVSGCSRRPAAPPAPAQKPAAAAPAPRVPTGSEVFASATTSLSTSLDSAGRALSRGSTDATAIAAVRGFAASLPELDRGVQADFAKTRGILAKVGSKEKDAIEARVERTYAKRRNALAKRLAAVSSAESTAALKTAIASTADYLDSITPEEPYQPLGTSLPHRIVDAHAGPPVLGARIAPAYAPNTPGAEPSTLPVTPTAADTTETVEIQFSPEITALVASLGADPVRMYEYVRNTIDFEPYYGSRKGATETLLEGSGNDIDTASLLIALYRAAGIPARYVSGVVDVPIEKAMNWVGVEVPEAAAKLFASGGTPTKLLISGGKPKALQIERTWAEVYVPYEDYRGTGEGTGERIWVPLDASWKEYEVLPPIQLDTNAIDPSAIMSALASGSVETSDSVTKCDFNAARNAMQSAAATLSASIATSPTVEQMLNIRPIVRSRLGVLPVATPLKAVSVASEWTAIPVAMQRRISASLPGGSTFTTGLAGLSSKRLTVSFLGATQADRDIMASYERIEDVPAYQIEVTPRISLDGEVVAEGAPVALGSPLDVTMTSIEPNTSDSFSSSVIAGGFYALVVDTGGVSLEAFSGHVDRYGEAVAGVQAVVADDESATVDADTLMGEMLHTAGLVYFCQLDAAYQMLSGPWRVVSTPMIAEGTVGTSLSTASLLGAVSCVRPTGVSLDVRSNLRAVQSVTGDPRMTAGFLQAAGSVGSLLEGLMIEQVFGLEGISTIRVLQIANNSSIPILAIDSSNSGLIDTLEYGAALKADLRDAVAAGHSIVIPKSGIDYYGYQGTGWIVTDPDTGEGGYMIAEGLGGSRNTGRAAGGGGGFSGGGDLNAATDGEGADSQSPEMSLMASIIINGIAAGLTALKTTASKMIGATVAVAWQVKQLRDMALQRAEATSDSQASTTWVALAYAMTFLTTCITVAAAGSAFFSGDLAGSISRVALALAEIMIGIEVVVAMAIAFGALSSRLVADWSRVKQRMLDELTELTR